MEDNKKLTQAMLDRWRDSKPVKDMIKANDYYRVEGMDIERKVRDINMSNAKLPSSFLRSSVNQKVNYGFSRPFMLSIDPEDGESQKDDPLLILYENEWAKLITPEFRKSLQVIAKNAINNGIGWAYVGINDEGKLYISSAESETVYPLWKDKGHTELDRLVRDYSEDAFIDGEFATITNVELWSDNDVTKYREDVEGLSQLEDQPEPHLFEEDGQGGGWGRIPFIALKGNGDELPLLNIIKAHIDAYNQISSKSVDSIDDDIDPIIVLRGVSAEVGKLEKARELLKSKKIASVEPDGGASYLQVDLNIDAAQKKLEHLRKDINEFSCTVNIQDIKFGSNPSGVALKAAYQDLDIFTNGLEMEFELFMVKLKYFFDRYMEFKGIATFDELKDYKLTVTLDRDMMINESEVISDVSKLSGLVSQETLDNYNPAVESHAIEQERREKEAEMALDREDPYLNMQESEPEEEEEEEEEE